MIAKESKIASWAVRWKKTTLGPIPTEGARWEGNKAPPRHATRRRATEREKPNGRKAELAGVTVNATTAAIATSNRNDSPGARGGRGKKAERRRVFFVRRSLTGFGEENTTSTVTAV